MKQFKTIFFALLLAVFSLAGCAEPDTDHIPDNPDLTEVFYNAFSKHFESGATAVWNDLGDGKYNMTFSDGSVVAFNNGEFPVLVSTVDSWPAVVVRSGYWRVDGKDTGIAYTADRSEERIVAVIYDTEGIYVRLSSGYMFFFHSKNKYNIGCFRFEKALNPTLSKDIVCTVDGTRITATLDAALTKPALIPTFGCRGGIGLVADGSLLVSSVSSVDCSSSPVRLFFEESSGRKTQYSLLFPISGDGEKDGPIPVLRITSPAITSKENYVTGTMRIEDPGLRYADVASETVDIEIRGRGNSTWGMPKKPYKVKLARKQRLLGMSDNRHWCLMANYSDKTLLRNSLAFKISELAGMSWAVRWVPVEVYLNGGYQGQYMLTEQVRTGSDRIEMSVVGANDNSGDAVKGGYLFCIDEKDLWDNPPKAGFWHQKNATQSIPVAFDEPEEPTQAQIDYAKALFNEIDDAIYHKSFAEYSKVIDVESVINFFFVNELAKNPDGNMRLSTYLAKPRDGKAYFPCVWDFDISFGNCDYGDAGGMWTPSGWWIRESVWMRQFFRNPDFCARVTEMWNELYPKLPQLEDDIRAWAAEIDDAQKRNFQKWNILGVKVWPNYVVMGSYKGEVDFLIDFIKKRAAWLNTEIMAGRHYRPN